jgi:phenylacetate-CoA ligase
MSHNEMMAFLRECRQSSLEAYGLKEDGCRLPFVWVFGRADFTVSYYGANIYPENVAVGLEQPELMNWLTGKFVMEVGEGIDGAKVLHIAVELLPSETANARKQSLIAQSISVQLLRLNSEFANYVPQRKQIPQVELLEFGNSEYFPTGVKHRYTRS